jgi:hypothetical protein
MTCAYALSMNFLRLHYEVSKKNKKDKESLPLSMVAV